MTYRDDLRELLKKDEGCVEHAYQDSEGFWTIGVGRLIDKRVGGKLSRLEIDLLLENDIEEAVETAKDLFPAFEGLSDSRKVVLCSMAFNLGRTRLGAFKKLRKAVEEKDWDQAAIEMSHSLWASQIGRRADRLIKMMREGVVVPFEKENGS